MRLQSRLRITTAASLGAVLLLAALLTWSLREIARVDGDVALARALAEVQYERALLRDEYLLTRGARARAQWAARTDILPGLLATARSRFVLPHEQAIVADANEQMGRTEVLFQQIAERDDDQAGEQPQSQLAEELRQRSIVALRVVAHDLYTHLRRLETLASGRLDATQRQTSLVLVLLLAGVVAITLINSAMVAATLQRRILLLRDGAEKVAAGDLEHRLRIRGDDELADLGRTFDGMAEKLLASRAALEASNRELEAFSYAVSHDLRAPLRSVSGFSQAVLEDYGPRLDATGRQYLELASRAAQEMGRLIDDLLGLSRVGRVELARQSVDLSVQAGSIVAELRREEPGRRAEVEIAPGLVAEGDPTLLRMALENLLRNAWKFSSHHPTAQIRVGRGLSRGAEAFFVSDDGAGFDMAYADKLFQPFQRLHRTAEFPGTGIGLATVRRIVRRHGGDAWADGAVEQGATIHFTLPAREVPNGEQDHPAR